MTYADETKRILGAIISGDCCPDCNAPNGDRHFDECPQHPENVPQRDLIRRAYVRIGMCKCTCPLCPVCDLISDLIAALERRPFVPIVDDLASERLDGLRDERDELLVRVDELTEELAVFRRQQPDDDAAKVRRVQ